MRGFSLIEVLIGLFFVITFVIVVTFMAFSFISQANCRKTLIPECSVDGIIDMTCRAEAIEHCNSKKIF